MTYLIEPEWIVGDVVNGHREPFQCPPNCRRSGAYDGTDTSIQFPRGWHVKAGRAMGIRGWQSFHQGEVFEPYRVRVIPELNHNGDPDMILQLVGGTLTEQKQAMLVRRFDAPVEWAEGAVVQLTTFFQPRLDGYANMVTAQQHLFQNVELRGELSRNAKWGANQVIGVFLRGTYVWLMFWDTVEAESMPSTMRRIEFPVSLELNDWHRLRIQLTGAAAENTWNARVRIAYQGRALVNWWSEKPIVGVKNVNVVAVGDERPNDNDGGTWWWERMRLERGGAAENG